MKKLSLVLALVLVLTCALVACGGETENSSTPASSTASSKVESSAVESSTPAESSESAVESSTPAESSTPVESSDETPVESSDETPVESTEDPSEAPSEPDEEPGEITNLALGVSYDAKGFQNTDEWGTANYTANLTDGAAATELTFDNNWFAFSTSEGTNGLNAPGGVGKVTLDLGKVCTLSSFKVNALLGDTQMSSGIKAPAKIAVYVDDQLIGELKTESKATDGGDWYVLNAGAKGQKVTFEVTFDGLFAFVNELEVYGY